MRQVGDWQLDIDLRIRVFDRLTIERRGEFGIVWGTDTSQPKEAGVRRAERDTHELGVSGLPTSVEARRSRMIDGFERSSVTSTLRGSVPRERAWSPYAG